MNPIAPISMLAGKGGATAIAVVAALTALALVAQAKTPPNTQTTSR